MKPRTIGITGGKGFLGRHISKALKIAGFKIIYFDLPENDIVNPDGAKLNKFVKNSDIIIHAAAVNRGTDAEVVAGSVEATLNLAEAVCAKNPKVKIIFTSSAQAETDSLYGRSKRLAENVLEELADKYGVKVSVFRLTNIFGEGGKPFYNSVVSTFASEAVRGNKLPVNDPKKTVKLLYVGEVVGEILKEVNAKRAKEFYFKRLDSRDEISIGRLAELMTGFAGEAVKPKTKLEKTLYKVYLSYARSGN